MLVATFNATTGWVGKTIAFENEELILEDRGPIPAAHVMEYDRRGQLTWVADEARTWVDAKAHASPGSPGQRALTDTSATTPAAEETATRSASGTDAPAQGANAGGMLIATFAPHTDLAGRKITREGNAFVLEGHGPITAADIMEYDRNGRLVWAGTGTRAWIGSKAQASLARATEIVPAPPAHDTVPPVGPPGKERPLTPQASGWKPRKVLITVIVGAVIAIALVAAVGLYIKTQGDHTAAAKAAATKTLQPFRKLDSALSVGINFASYGKLVRDAQFALDSYRPTDSVGQDVAQHLEKAAEAYRVANDAWNDDIQDEFDYDAETWNAACPALALPAGAVTAEDVEQAAWVVASENVEQAWGRCPI